MDILTYLKDLICYIINFVIWLFGSCINLILELLPNTPFNIDSTGYSLVLNEYLPYLNWFLPVGQMLGIGLAWLGCMSLYYIYSVVLRWIKMIE